MKWTLALPVLGALALMAALPDRAEARSRSSFDISIGVGSSHHHHGYHRGGYDSGVSFRYSSGRSYGHDHYSHYRPTRYYSAPRYYAPRPVYREVYVEPAPRYYDNCDYGYRPVVRYYSPAPRYYSSEYYCR